MITPYSLSSFLTTAAEPFASALVDPTSIRRDLVTLFGALNEPRRVSSALQQRFLEDLDIDQLLEDELNQSSNDINSNFGGLETVFEDALLEVKTGLQEFAANDSFSEKVNLAFGQAFDHSVLENLAEQWIVGDLSAFPKIEFRSTEELNNARAAFSAETNTIYVSDSQLEQYASDSKAIANLLLAEYGHFVDATINQVDAPGDEGEIFASLVQNVYLSDATLQSLKLEDDSAMAFIDGFALQVEQATSDVGNGLKGDYFDNSNLTNLKLTRVDSTVNFSWGSGSPNSAIAPDTFSVRWTGQVQAANSGTYTFFTQADDGVRLWVNGQQLINRWTNSSQVENRGSITLTGGQKYDIKLEYYENSGSAVAKLLWSGPGITKQVIPQSYLFAGDVTSPTATLSAPNVTPTAGTTYDFTVTYSDNVAVNVATLGNGDIRVTGPNGFNQLASLVNVSSTSNGTPLTATYRINAPGGTWDAADIGNYAIALQANQVSDTNNNFMAASTLGTFTVLDTVAPTASATVANITTGGGTMYDFTVTYTDNIAVNVATLDGNDVQVTGPNNFSQAARLISVSANSNGTPRTATYRIDAPGGNWDLTDNGRYTVTLNANQVSDTSGNFIAASDLNAFSVELAPPGSDENIVFPADAGVLNVKDFGAKGDGITDDTAAIQAALNAYPNGMRIIYLPNGIYRVSDTLTWPAGTPGTGNDYKNTILQGQSERGAIIQLFNNAARFSDPNNPKPVIFTGPAPAQRFGNSIRNLTVDTGTGNPGAIGVQFNASNQGSMRKVTVQSGDGQGVAGLDFDFADEIGPLLVKDVTVKGFQYGIQSGYTVNSQTFENITLQNQSVYGFWNYSQVINIRNLTSNNSVPAIYNALSDAYNPNALGHMTLLNATLNGVGGASSQSAIVNGGTLLARNLTTTGYQSAIASGSTIIPGGTVAEFVSKPTTSLFTSPQQTLNLPIKETPDVPWDNLTDWANVRSFGAVPNDGLDDTAAIQAAIDSGKTTIYLPVGSYNLSQTVFIRNNARRIIGTEAYVEVPNTVNPGFKVIDGSSPVVVFERIQSGYNATPTIENASSRTLVIRDATNVSGNMTGSGDVFIENVVSNPSQSWTFNQQNVWARQFNVENLGTHITNNGGNLWIFGLKTERGGTLIDTKGGGKTELLGGLAYTTTAGPNGTQNYPMFINNESSVSLSFAEVNYGAPKYTTYVQEIRGGVTRNLSGSSLPNYWGIGEDIPLYVGYQG